jgi:multiple antibiotic resistance protein
MTEQIGTAIALVSLVFGTLVSIINPPSSVPIFLAMTPGCSTALRRVLAGRIAFNVFVILVVSMFVGSHILSFFGLSLPIVQLGGGLLITSIGWRLLNQADPAPAVSDAPTWPPEELAGRAFYPLTLPLTVGPGSISVSITLGANTPRAGAAGWALSVSMVVGVALIALSIYFCYRYAETISRVLGRTGTSVFLRLSAFISLCIGVQITWNGLVALIRPLLAGVAR